MKLEWEIIGDKNKINDVLEKLIEQVRNDVEEQQEYLEASPKKILGIEVQPTLFMIICDKQETENGYLYSNELPALRNKIVSKLLKWKVRTKMENELVKYFQKENVSMDLRRIG